MGIFSGEPAIHVVPRIEPAPHGSDREDRRARRSPTSTKAGLQGFSTALTPRVTWRDRGGDPQQYEFGGIKNDTRVDGEGEESRARRRRRQERIDRDVPAAARVLLHARSGHEPRLHLVPQGRANAQFGIGVRQADGEEEPQYVENFALHNAPPGTLQRMAVYFLMTPDSRRGHAAGGDGVHARRRVQAGARLQDDGEPFPPAVHRAAARIGIARQHVRRSDGDALDRHQHRRPERLPRRSASERSRARAVRGPEGLLRGVAEGVRQGLPRHQLGRADARISAATTTSCSRRTCTGRKVRQPGQPFTENVPGLRQGVPHGQHDRRAGDAGRRGRRTGSTRIRAPRARPAIRTRSSTRPG